MVVKGIKCENPGCPVVFENKAIEPEMTYDIRVELSDHTGTLTNCRLTGHSAEIAMDCTVSIICVLKAFLSYLLLQKKIGKRFNFYF